MRALPAHPARTTPAILILVLCSLLSSVRMIFNVPRPRNGKPDGIAARSDQRYAGIKTRLPASGVVGYIGESGDSTTPDYYLTQYALAPLVVDYSSDHTIVIGNFPSARLSVIPTNLQLVEDFGNGVLLFAGKDSK